MKHFVHRPRCDLCRADTLEILISVGFTDPRVWRFLRTYYDGRIDPSVVDGAHFEIARCNACAFAWQTYVLDDPTTSLLYSAWISAEQSLDKKRYAEASLFRKYAREAEEVGAFFSDKPHEVEVLDFGMGWGYWCRMPRPSATESGASRSSPIG